MGVLLPLENPENSFSNWDGLMKFYSSKEGIDMKLDYREGIDKLADFWIIGLPVETMGDSETKEKFRRRVFELLQKYGYVGQEQAVDFRLDGGYC